MIYVTKNTDCLIYSKYGEENFFLVHWGSIAVSTLIIVMRWVKLNKGWQNWGKPFSSRSLSPYLVFFHLTCFLSLDLSLPLYWGIREQAIGPRDWDSGRRTVWRFTRPSQIEFQTLKPWMNMKEIKRKHLKNHKWLWCIQIGRPYLQNKPHPALPSQFDLILELPGLLHFLGGFLQRR